MAFFLCSLGFYHACIDWVLPVELGLRRHGLLLVSPWLPPHLYGLDSLVEQGFADMAFFLCPLSRYNWRRAGLRVGWASSFVPTARICETGSLVTLLSTTLRTSCPSTTLTSVNMVRSHFGQQSTPWFALWLMWGSACLTVSNGTGSVETSRLGFQLEERLERLLASHALVLPLVEYLYFVLIVPSQRFRFLHSLWLS